MVKFPTFVSNISCISKVNFVVSSQMAVRALFHSLYRRAKKRANFKTKNFFRQSNRSYIVLTLRLKLKTSGHSGKFCSKNDFLAILCAAKTLTRACHVCHVIILFLPSSSYFRTTLLASNGPHHWIQFLTFSFISRKNISNIYED